MFATILLVIVIVVVALFSVQNAIPVSISFLSWRFDASLAVIALLFFLAGMIAGMVVLFWTRMRRTARKRSETRQKQSDGERAPDL
jgi:putative membrane protein